MDKNTLLLDTSVMTQTAHEPLSRDQIVETLRQHESELKLLGLTSLTLFGSRARGDHRPDSDLDLIVDYDTTRKFSLVDLVHAEHFIEDLIDCPVQIITRSSVPAAKRAHIESEQVVVL